MRAALHASAMTSLSRRGGNVSHVEIRRACLDDVPQLCSLLAELFTQEADFTPDAERQGMDLAVVTAILMANEQL